MTDPFDVIIVGSGPAGVSVAFPLLEAGLRVFLADGGRNPSIDPPLGSFLGNRAHDEEQWKWMIGEDFRALSRADAVSPKLRVPPLDFVFDGFETDNRIDASDFIAIGSMAAGGLSNAWGCGVAALTREELADYPFDPGDLNASFARVARRIGVSGGSEDDLADYFGLNSWADAPLPMDRLQSELFARYAKRRKSLFAGFQMGRARLAALSRDLGDRLACDQSGACLWGCGRRSLYSARDDLVKLRRYANLTYASGFVVREITSDSPLVSVIGRGPQGERCVAARRVVLAAGTLASTRLVLQALRHVGPVPLQACPTAAFLIWAPTHLGQPREAAFGLAQLAFVLGLKNGVRGFGGLFNSTGIPLAEFSRYLPMRRRLGVDVLSRLMSSCAVGNFFLPGRYTRASLRLNADQSLHVEGRYADDVRPLMAEVERKLRASFLKLGALLLPTSFQLGRPGGDIHYSASLPMRAAPGIGECDCDGELHGLADVHVVDGAALPSLPAKPHTLIVMANADRIGRRLAARLSPEAR